LTQDVFFQHHPIEFHIRMLLLKHFGEPLHPDHVAIVDGGNGHCFGGLTDKGEG
jgi:hypothetical protein